MVEAPPLSAPEPINHVMRHCPSTAIILLYRCIENMNRETFFTVPIDSGASRENICHRPPAAVGPPEWPTAPAASRLVPVKQSRHQQKATGRRFEFPFLLYSLFIFETFCTAPARGPSAFRFSFVGALSMMKQASRHVAFGMFLNVSSCFFYFFLCVISKIFMSGELV